LNRTLGEKLNRVEAEVENAAEVVLSASGTEALGLGELIRRFKGGMRIKTVENRT
jgi:hypothetical protein